MAMRMTIDRKWNSQRRLGARPMLTTRRLASRRPRPGVRVLPMSLIWRRRMAPLVTSRVARTTLVAAARPSTGPSVPSASAVPSMPMAHRLAPQIVEAVAPLRGAAQQGGSPSSKATHHHTVERQTSTFHTHTATVRAGARLPLPLTMRWSSPVATPRPERVTLLRQRMNTIAPASAAAPPARSEATPGPATTRAPIEMRRRSPSSAGSRHTIAAPRALSERSHSTVETVLRSQTRTHHLAERHFRSFATELRRERAERIRTLQPVTSWNEIPLTFRAKLRTLDGSPTGNPRQATSPHGQSPAGSDGRSPPQSDAVEPARHATSPKPAVVVDAALASRLADDVMRRIEQRLRIERERFGI